MVYGGSKCGLMGALAESVLKAGGEVTGVESQFFVEIRDADEIHYIVENIQNTKMKQDKLSLNYTGYSFRMKFCSETGKEFASFILNSENTIRKDPFFYRCDGGLCYDYLKELEEKQS